MVVLRLGPGDWADEEITRGEARDWFLAAVRRVAPEVLEALRGEPWRAYLHLRAEADLCRDPEGWEQVTAQYRERYGDRVALFILKANQLRTARPPHGTLTKSRAPGGTPPHDGAVVYESDLPFAYGRDVLPPLRWSTVRLAEGDFLPDLLPLQRALRAWAERFHLDERYLPLDWWTYMTGDTFRIEHSVNLPPDALPPIEKMTWTYDVALETLRYWTDYPKAAELLEWDLPGWAVYAPVGDEERRFVFEHAGWDPVGLTSPGETRAQARKRILGAFEAALDGYLDRMEALAAERGLQRTPAKRNPEAFQWLVLYQCAGWSILRIARDHHVARQTVADQLEATANLIGLRLRAQDKGGRPRNPAS